MFLGGAEMSSGMIPYAMVKWVWIVFIVFWVLAAFVQKRNARRQTVGSRLMQFSIIFLVLVPFFVESGQAGLSYRHLYPSQLVLQYFGVLLLLLGFGFAVWARFVLGRNANGRWHSERGPHINYARTLRMGAASDLYRDFAGAAGHGGHPGNGAQLLGSADGRAGTLAEAAHGGEVAVIESFGEQYTAYRRHVKALIPHLI